MEKARKFWEEELKKAREKFDRAKTKATLKKYNLRMQECRMYLRDLD